MVFDYFVCAFLQTEANSKLSLNPLGPLLALGRFLPLFLYLEILSGNFSKVVIWDDLCQYLVSDNYEFLDDLFVDLR